MLRIYLILHQHWDPAWVFRRKDTIPQLIILFNDVLRKMRKYPTYKFVLDGQTHLIEDYLAQLPPAEARKRMAELSVYAREGRLMVGPFYSQVDWFIAGEELLIRNLLLGHKDAERLGGVMKVGWLIDNFGFPGATPKILKEFGIDSVFISRGIGIESRKVKDAYLWEADGSRALCFHLLESYRNAMNLGEMPEIAEERLKNEIDCLLPFSCTGETILLFDGYENLPKADDVVPVVEEINRKGDFELVICSPGEYVNVIKKYRPKLDKVTGYLNHGKYNASLRGVLSNRVGLKLKQKRAEMLLARFAEPLSSVVWLSGGEYPGDSLEKLWRDLIKISCHDEVCGCSIDDVYEDVDKIYERVLEGAEEISKRALEHISRNVDTSWVENGMGIIVFNPSPWQYDGVAKIAVELPRGMDDCSFLDREGCFIPFQILRKKGDRAEIALRLKLPPFGYKTYALTSEPAEVKSEGLEVNQNSAENDFVKIQINENGTVDLFDKKNGRVYRGLGYFKSEGDRGDLYTPSCLKDGIRTSKDCRAKISSICKGPLLARFKIELEMLLPGGLVQDRTKRSPKTKKYPILTYVELTGHSPRVDFETSLNNVVKDHRLRTCFPTGLSTDCVWSGQQFDVAKFPVHPDPKGYGEHPPLENIVLPAWDTKPPDGEPHHSFIDLCDGKAGLGLITDLLEHQITQPENTIELTLLRGVGWLGLDQLPVRRGRAGWELRVPEAQSIGKHAFRYSLMPHSDDWFKTKLHAESTKVLNGIAAAQTGVHEGRLPSEACFLSLDSRPRASLEIKAIKRSEDRKDLVLRIFNHSNSKARGELRTFWPLEKACLCNSNEEALEELIPKEEKIRFHANGKQILTLRLRLSRKKLLDSEATASLLPQAIQEKETWLEIKAPQPITARDLAREKIRVKKARKKFERAKRRVRSLERAYRFSKKPLDKYELERARLEMFKLAENLQDAEYSLLLSEKKFIRLTAEPHEVEKKLGPIQRKIDRIANKLIEPRAKRQGQEFIVRCLEPRIQ